MGRSRRDTWKEMMLGTWLEVRSQKEAHRARVEGTPLSGLQPTRDPHWGSRKRVKTQGALDENK